MSVSVDDRRSFVEELSCAIESFVLVNVFFESVRPENMELSVAEDDHVQVEAI